MNDENQMISVQIPAEIFKEISTVTEEAKSTLNSQDTITLQVSAQTVSKLTELRIDIESFQRSLVDEQNSRTDRYIRVSEMRIAFFEKLILLAGGSLALSLTFLASLQRHLQGKATPLSAMGKYETAWVLLVVSIVFSWLHNLSRSSAAEYFMVSTGALATATEHMLASNLTQRAATIFGAAASPSTCIREAMEQTSRSLREISKKSKKGSADQAADTARNHRISAILGAIALFSIIVAFGLMVFFAVKNSALL